MLPEHDLCRLQYITSLVNMNLELASSGSWSLDTLEPLRHLTCCRSPGLQVEDMRGPLLLHPSLSCLMGLTRLEPLKVGCTARA